MRHFFTGELGPFVVTGTRSGGLRLNDHALKAQLHQAHSANKTLQWCNCQRCRWDRERKPVQAPVQPSQPWEGKKAA